MPDYKQLSLEMHEEKKGKMEIKSKVRVTNKDELSTAYTPGVAEPCRVIAENKEDVYKYTIKANTIAVVTDGSALLGLGNVGPEASLPVMEGKAILLKEFADVDAFPICLDTQDTEEIIQTVINIAPGFGGINLEDISSPRCFEIEKRLEEALDIPVFHDDQHGTAIVVLAGLINALKVTGKKKEDVKVVVSGVGAAGVAVTKLLLAYGFQHFYMCDSKGLIYKGREERMNVVKEEMAEITNQEGKQGSLADALVGTDIFLGVSHPDIVNEEMVKSMNPDPIIFAMANPDPEIRPEKARAAGAAVIATGRSDFPNQINNVLAFPGIFRGLLDMRAQSVSMQMKTAAAEAIAAHVENPTAEMIIPPALDKTVAEKVAGAVKSAA